MKQKVYMISDAAKRVDVESHVLRYWEEELALPIMRNEMGHRCYTEENILLLQNVKCLKDQGFALKAVRLLLPELSRRTPQSLANLFLLREQLNQRAEEIDTGGGEIHSKDAAENDPDGPDAGSGRENIATPAASDEKNTSTQAASGGKNAATQTTSGGKNAATQAASDEKNTSTQAASGEKNAATQTTSGGKNAATQTKKAALKKQNREATRQEPETGHADLPAASEWDPDVPTPAEQKLLQFQTLVGQAVEQAVSQSVSAVMQEQLSHSIKQALADNNRRLVQDMSRQLSCDICEDLDGLLQEREQRDEERYRNLDNAIRERQRVHKEAAAVSLDRLSGRKSDKKSRKNQRNTTQCALLPARKR